jgi:hypothetical protein
MKRWAFLSGLYGTSAHAWIVLMGHNIYKRPGPPGILREENKSMRKIITMAVMLGMAGGAYAGTAAEQLGLDGDIVAIRLPVGDPEPVDASLSKGGNSLNEKMADLVRMFSAGKPLPQKEMAYVKNSGELTTGTIILEAVHKDGTKTLATAAIFMRVTPLFGPDMGPLWSNGVIGFDYSVSIGRPFHGMMEGKNMETSPQSNIVTLHNENGVVQDGRSMDIVLRENGKHIIGSIKWKTPTAIRTGFFYLWTK